MKQIHVVSFVRSVEYEGTDTIPVRAFTSRDAAEAFVVRGDALIPLAEQDCFTPSDAKEELCKMRNMEYRTEGKNYRGEAVVWYNGGTHSSKDVSEWFEVVSLVLEEP